MKPATTGGAPYKVPREHDGWRSLTLAAAMHALLVLFLWFGVHWQSNKPVAVEAEVWDMTVQQAAPPAPPAPPAPEPEEQPVVKAPPPPALVEAPPTPKEPDIALERQKAKQKAAEEKAQEETKQAKLQKELDDKQAKLKAKEDARKKELAEEKAQEEKDKQEQMDKDKKLAADKKAAADKLAKAKLAADQKVADKARAAEMSRITGAVGAGTNGTAAKSTGPKGDPSYQGALIAAIRSRLAYSSSDDTLTARVSITQLPTGEVLGTKMVKSSGNAAYDSAILRAIGAASPLPKKKDGTVEREITAEFNLKDLH